MAEISVRRAEERDVKEIAFLETVCFSDPWSVESVYHDVVENRLAFYVVAESENKVIGYAGVWNILDEGHITNVAVSPDYRRMHAATLMLDLLIEVTENAGIKRHTLEVRAGNEGAIALYQKHGFKVGGIRKGYYRDNGEDALIMWRE